MPGPMTIWRGDRFATRVGSARSRRRGRGRVTERVRLGPLVASPNFRHPVPFAKELTVTRRHRGRPRVDTRNRIRRRRLGRRACSGRHVGPGENSLDRFAEFVELTDRLLREPEVTHDGRFYSANGTLELSGLRAEAPNFVRGRGRRTAGDGRGGHLRRHVGHDGRSRRQRLHWAQRKAQPSYARKWTCSTRSVHVGGARPRFGVPAGALGIAPRVRAGLSRRVRRRPSAATRRRE